MVVNMKDGEAVSSISEPTGGESNWKDRLKGAWTDLKGRCKESFPNSSCSNPFKDCGRGENNDHDDNSVIQYVRDSVTKFKENANER